MLVFESVLLMSKRRQTQKNCHKCAVNQLEFVRICELVGTYAYIQLIEVLEVLVMFLQCKGSVTFLCVRGVQRSLFVQTSFMCQSYRHRLGYILKP